MLLYGSAYLVVQPIWWYSLAGGTAYLVVQYLV